MEASPARPPHERDWGMLIRSSLLLIRSSLVLIRSSLVPAEEPGGRGELVREELGREELREVSSRACQECKQKSF